MPRIICAFAEPARGPGWANTPIWIVSEHRGKLSLRCLQPEEQTEEMLTLYSVSAAAHAAMTRAVERASKRSR